jgi:hypothetical protein
MHEERRGPRKPNEERGEKQTTGRLRHADLPVVPCLLVRFFSSFVGRAEQRATARCYARTSTAAPSLAVIRAPLFTQPS